MCVVHGLDGFSDPVDDVHDLAHVGEHGQVLRVVLLHDEGQVLPVDHVLVRGVDVRLPHLDDDRGVGSADHLERPVALLQLLVLRKQLRHRADERLEVRVEHLQDLRLFAQNRSRHETFVVSQLISLCFYLFIIYYYLFFYFFIFFGILTRVRRHDFASLVLLFVCITL